MRSKSPACFRQGLDHIKDYRELQHLEPYGLARRPRASCRKILAVGAVIYGIGSFITGISQNIAQLLFGWSLIEGLDAILVIPAILSLAAVNYKDKDRVIAYSIIGGISGAAAAAGPLIGGFVTTYASWRYVFLSESLIMALVLLFFGIIKDKQTEEALRKKDSDIRRAYADVFSAVTQ